MFTTRRPFTKFLVGFFHSNFRWFFKRPCLLLCTDLFRWRCGTSRMTTTTILPTPTSPSFKLSPPLRQRNLLVTEVRRHFHIPPIVIFERDILWLDISHWPFYPFVRSVRTLKLLRPRRHDWKSPVHAPRPPPPTWWRSWLDGITVDTVKMLGITPQIHGNELTILFW